MPEIRRESRQVDEDGKPVRSTKLQDAQVDLIMQRPHLMARVKDPSLKGEPLVFIGRECRGITTLNKGEVLVAELTEEDLDKVGRPPVLNRDVTPNVYGSSMYNC